MLYWLLYEQIYPFFGPARLFSYVTVRAALAGLTALLLSLLLGPWMIRRLRMLAIGQHIREEVTGHAGKAGTPTMGGVLIFIAIVVPTLLWTNLRNYYVWVALFGLCSFSAVGFWDDYTKVKRMRNLGITARQKLLLQLLASIVIGIWLLVLHSKGLYDTSINVPFFKQFHPSLLVETWLQNKFTYPFAFVFFLGFVALILSGCSNAVNLTDGLDGLATGLMIITASAMTALTYISGHRVFAEYLDLVRIPGTSELTVFCAAMTGASVGFLWYNAHPAQVFMGDIGALGLGGALGTVAVLIKQELLLPLIGGVYIIEMLSVMLQVASFKLRGKRIFKMSPLHHHFELSGWAEPQIITRFWIIGLVMALFALATLKLR